MSADAFILVSWDMKRDELLPLDLVPKVLGVNFRELAELRAYVPSIAPLIAENDRYTWETMELLRGALLTNTSSAWALNLMRCAEIIDWPRRPPGAS
jgi:hypothetical protein